MVGSLSGMKIPPLQIPMTLHPHGVSIHSNTCSWIVTFDPISYESISVAMYCCGQSSRALTPWMKLKLPILNLLPISNRPLILVLSLVGILLLLPLFVSPMALQ